MKDLIVQQLKTLRELDLPVFLTGGGFVNAEKYVLEKETDEDFIKYNLNEIENVYAIIPLLFEKTNRYYYKASSYGLKHYCSEMYTHVNPNLKNTYMSNGGFIMAMLLHGYEWKKIACTQNCHFKLKKIQIFRTCKSCLHDKYILEFPKMKTKINRRCDDCCKVFNRTHKNGYDLIPDETKIKINEYISDGFALSHIANKFNIPYPNLFYWQKKGFLQK